MKGRLVVGHKSDGRSIYDEGAKKESIVASLRQGVSVARMAVQHGVNANLLRTWIAAHQRRSIQESFCDIAQTPGAAFVAVQVDAERDHAQRVPQREHEHAEAVAPHLPVTAVAVMAGQRSSLSTLRVFRIPSPALTDRALRATVVGVFQRPVGAQFTGIPPGLTCSPNS